MSETLNFGGFVFYRRGGVSSLGMIFIVYVV